MEQNLQRFTTTVSKHLICTICLSVFIDPVQDNDDHIFCKKCVEPWVSKNFTCPIDRKKLFLTDLKPASRTIKNLLDELEITCDYKDHGCKRVLKLEALPKHVRECEYNPNKIVICPNGCELTVQVAKLKEHSCIKELKTECKKLRLDLDKSNQEWKKALQNLQDQFSNEIKKIRQESRLNESTTLMPTYPQSLIKPVDANKNLNFISGLATNLASVTPSASNITSLTPSASNIFPNINPPNSFVPITENETLVTNSGNFLPMLVAYQNVSLHFDQQYSFEELRYFNLNSKKNCK